MKNLYITTAIDYANGEPHIGHSYEKILADSIARYNRLKGNKVFFLTGLDEHGQKIQKTAEKLLINPQELCNIFAEKYQKICKDLNISNDDYIRTSEERHKNTVTKILIDLYNQGEIYKSDYKGYYSIKEEQFLQEKDKINNQWPSSYGEVIQVNESNYFLNIKKHQEWLINYIEDNHNFIIPKFQRKQVLEFLKTPINDLCISRPKSRVNWGITIPFDKDYVCYVWFDALINYISAIQYGNNLNEFQNYWPVDCHIIGKDILIPAHAIYWPIILKIINLSLPKCLIVHGWWMIEGEKMSKSKQNTINPLELIKIFGTDVFRYFLLREIYIGQDSNFSKELFLKRYNDDLRNDLGNLLSRFTQMIKLYSNNKIPSIDFTKKIIVEKILMILWQDSKIKILNFFDENAFNKALEEIFIFINEINRYIEKSAPWKLAKLQNNQNNFYLDYVLASIGEAIRLTAVILKPIMPNISEIILKDLGYQDIDRFDNFLDWSFMHTINAVQNRKILFPEIKSF